MYWKGQTESYVSWKTSLNQPANLFVSVSMCPWTCTEEKLYRYLLDWFNVIVVLSDSLTGRHNFLFSAEITRLEKEKEADLERFEHQKDQLNSRLKQLERDSQMALAQEKQAHEEDCERLTRERVRCKLGPMAMNVVGVVSD